ncbi:MAG: hypothetical protein V3U24_08505 [Candidatus Neomarinimicrobiota bacterium]
MKFLTKTASPEEGSSTLHTLTKWPQDSPEKCEKAFLSEASLVCDESLLKKLILEQKFPLRRTAPKINCFKWVKRDIFWRSAGCPRDLEDPGDCAQVNEPHIKIL